MRLDQNLYDAVVKFIDARFGPNSAEGAAAMYTETGDILLSTGDPGSVNPAASLCYETGAICEAHKLGKKITATICLERDQTGKIRVLAPCGICQERLMFWGENIEVGVPLESNSSLWQAKQLKDLQPHYWYKPFLNPNS